MMDATEARTFSNMSAANAAIVASHFACGCEPYDQVFTYKRWFAQGMQVQKGEKGLRLETLVPIFKEDENGEKAFSHCRPVTTVVFCRHQVAPKGDNGKVETQPEVEPKPKPKPKAKKKAKPKAKKKSPNGKSNYPAEIEPNLRMSATFYELDDNGVKIGERNYGPGQAWEMLKAHKRPYSGAPKLNQLPQAKKGYKGKNALGGRKCKFSTARGY